MVNTKIIKIDPRNANDEHLLEAANTIKNGGLVIIPTETVYGICANMRNTLALKRLEQIKERPKNKPFSLHISSSAQVEEFAKDIPIQAYKLMYKFWPGPLTLVFKAKSGGTIGVRMPDDDIALKIIALSGVPVVCPSANISGKPAPSEFSDAIADLNGKVDLAVDTGPTRIKTESSVVDFSATPFKILREAAVKKQEIESAASKKQVLFICTGNSCRSVIAQAMLQKKLKQRGDTNVEVFSAGIMTAYGMGATEEVRKLLWKEGIDVSSHRSKRVSQEMIKSSDLILVMEKIHEEKIISLVPETKNRVFLLKEFAKINGNNLDISDPIGMSSDFYEQTFAVINEALERIVGIL